MMFWDSSAVVPLLLQEDATSVVRRLLGDDAQMAVWCLTPLEILSALWRLHRAEDLQDRARDAAQTGLRQLEQSWTVVVDLTQVERRARRILAVHPLRAADAAQLAAALSICGERSELLPWVCLDQQLSAAARKEGFEVLP